MKKTIVLSALASLVVSVYAADSSFQAQIDELKSKIEALQKAQNEQMSKQQTAQVGKQEIARVDELEERIDKVETASMVNKINWGVDFRTRVDSFKRTTADGIKSSNNDVWSNRLRLNMSSVITDDMKFTGRVVMYKNWADDGSGFTYSGMDPMQGRRPSDSSVFVDRAYVDWTVLKGNVPVALTIGRQPSSDGPSHQFKDNTVRKSTYSALSFDGGADGVVATVGLSKITSIPDMALRFGYGKGYQQNTGASYVGASGGIADTKVVGAFLDAGLGIAGSLVQVSAVKATDVVSNSNVQGQNKNIGDVSLYTAMVEFTNLADTNLDLFAHYAISVSKPNGTLSQFDINGDGVADTGYDVGLLTSTFGDTSDKKGHAFWMGGRYTFSSEMLNNPRIGLEYNHGSQNWFSFTQGSNDVTNKLATRGDAIEAYYIQPINRYAYLRTGAQFIDYDYSGSGMQIGAPTVLTSPGYGSQLDKLKNYYLLFNVSY
ncbi:MAG: DUF3373 family protein [Sulfuricurvum sp.]|nr:DUF3373 family protein [Sulfuricurvum sp.]MDD5387368.1 DUF3373 family protein [Sulfuricurvum sp.]